MFAKKKLKAVTDRIIVFMPDSMSPENSLLHVSSKEWRESLPYSVMMHRSWGMLLTHMMRLKVELSLPHCASPAWYLHRAQGIARVRLPNSNK